VISLTQDLAVANAKIEEAAKKIRRHIEHAESDSQILNYVLAILSRDTPEGNNG